MYFQRGMAKPPNSGRRIGTPNKSTAKVREAFEVAFERIGGVDALVTWATESPEHRTEFYKMYIRLLPTDIYTSSGAIHIHVDESVKDA